MNRKSRALLRQLDKLWDAYLYFYFLYRRMLRESNSKVPSFFKRMYPTKIWGVLRVAVISAKNHKRQRRKRQSVTAKRENSQTPKVLTAILTLPNLTKPNLA